MARQPRSASRSITLFAACLRTIDRTATQSVSYSGATVGACMPGVMRLASSSTSSGQS